MNYGFDDFCRDAHDALKQRPDSQGREEVRRLLERLLANKEFVAAHVGPDAPVGRHKLYEDADLGFVVLGHVNEGSHTSPPHDHGSSWAIYGQASEYTDMTEWERADGGDDAGEARVEKVRTYRLKPGKAGLYDVGAIHSIDYPAGARFVRVTGVDLDHVRRLKYDRDSNRAIPIESATTSA